jgi:hypothetical protein
MTPAEKKYLAGEWIKNMFQGTAAVMSDARAENVIRFAKLAVDKFAETFPVDAPGNVPPERGPDWKHTAQEGSCLPGLLSGSPAVCRKAQSNTAGVFRNSEGCDAKAYSTEADERLADATEHG